MTSEAPGVNVLDFTVRRGTNADAAALAEFGARVFVQTYAAVNTAEDMNAYLARWFSIEACVAELSDEASVVWLAEDATGAAIGYALLHRDTAAACIDAARPAEVGRIYAERGWHGRRLGRALMDACIAQSKTWGCDVLWLGVWEQNPRAIAFYEKAGFRAVGTQTFLLGSDVQNDLVMALAL